jgi:hypothetical protein
MRLNGTVNIERDDNAIYVLSYAPLGVDHFGSPRRRFKGWQQMVAFPQGPRPVSRGAGRVGLRLRPRLTCPPLSCERTGPWSNGGTAWRHLQLASRESRPPRPR